MDLSSARTFSSRAELAEWLKEHHATSRELWVRIFKKGSSQPSVRWEDCVVVAIAWGWIDGQRRALDEGSFLQRLTPRRPKSDWSRKNREHAERLIAEGEMQPSGLAHVVAARADGRWERAYAGSAEMSLPEDFLLAVEASPAAKLSLASLNRQELFFIYHRLHTARSADTRARRLVSLVEALAAGRSPSRG